MHPTQKQFHDFVLQHQLIEKEDKVLLAVSGGMDSMVMLDLFCKAEYPIEVAHCNFGLRGDASDKDALLVEERCREYEVNCHIKKFDLGNHSIQVKAREERYNWFELLSCKAGISKIATAHHLDDALETTLLNLIRGTGINGLKGIPLLNGKIIRPLLSHTKEGLRDYAKEHQVRWREDASNQLTNYKRNKLRKKVIPVLKELNPNLIETYSDTQERLAYTAKIMRNQVEETKETHFSSSEGRLDLSWIKGEEDLIIVAEILSEYGFNYATSREIFKARHGSGKSFPEKVFTAYLDRSSLFIQSNQKENKAENLRIEAFGRYVLREKKIDVRLLDQIPASLNRGRFVAFLDAEKVQFPLVIRSWEQGDHFQPLGMKGSKKVSDFLIDEKVPLAAKEDVLILADQNYICWVVGMRISEAYKVSSSTHEVVAISID